MRTKRLLSLFVATVLCLCSFSVFATDVQTTGGIDYSDMSNWAYWNEGEGKQADLFFVCPTVDMGKDGNLNADIENAKYRESFMGAINMEIGIYNDVATVYAPYYRQATFPVYNLSREDREKYLSIAYEDVKQAFLYYAENTDASRPLILAGFSQGSDLVIRLLKDLFDDPKYQERLVAAYCIGWKLTEEEVNQYPHLKPAVNETDTGAIIAFNSEDKDISSSLIIGENEKTYAINPLNWKTTSEVADKSLNKGACFTDYSANIKQEIPNLTGTYIDEKRGALKVTDIVPEEYPGKLFENGIYHLYDYQFFFRNLQENVTKRVDAFCGNYDCITVFYNDKQMTFDVEPVIENGRTLVPLRAIFEIMGCAVYYTEEDGKQIVSARRAEDSLLLTISENKMYFNSKEIALDVPAQIKDGRTLIPLRAVSEAFECEVRWEGDKNRIYIYSPATAYAVNNAKLSENITDENGNVLVEAVAYYPVIENPTNIPLLDTMNEEFKREAELFIEDAKSEKENAAFLRAQMGADVFKPFVFELTYRQTCNIEGEFSFTNYKYVNMGGIHPSVAMESKSFGLGSEQEYALSDVLAVTQSGVSLSDYVINLFVDKLKEIAPESAEIYTYDYVSDYIGSVQFYMTSDSIVLYFNQGVLAPYALGVICVEIPNVNANNQ